MVHITISPAIGASDILLILQGKSPPASDSEEFVTNNQSHSAGAVIMGGAYDDKGDIGDAGRLREQCAVVEELYDRVCSDCGARVWEVFGREKRFRLG